MNTSVQRFDIASKPLGKYVPLNNERAKKWLLDNAAKDEFGNLVPGQTIRHPDGYANLTVRSPDDGLVTFELRAFTIPALNSRIDVRSSTQLV